MEEENMKVVEIVKVLKDEYEEYRRTHEKSEIMEWIRAFKEKYGVKDLPIDIYFYKAWGSGIAELGKMNIIFTDRSKELYHNINKRMSGGYYIIIYNLDKERVSIKIDFSDALLTNWYGEKDLKGKVEDIFSASIKDLEGQGVEFKYLNSDKKEYEIEGALESTVYIEEMKMVINNYPKIMKKYLEQYGDLNDKYEKLFYENYEKRGKKQGKLFTKYVWALIHNEYGKEPNLKNIEEKEKNNEKDEEIEEIEENNYSGKEYNFMSRKEIGLIEKLLKYNKNIILEGVPGVGKTYIARKIANEITFGKEENVKLIQFHQSYAYEDFVQGLRPTENGTFEPVDGILKVICDKAKEDIDNNYVLIIDEINRGNISKIFGETFMLIEKDKRITKKEILENKNSKYAVNLPYKREEKFDIPENVYFIGTMNTMDKSIALMDFALRRRFEVYEIKPCFEDEEGNSIIGEYLKDVGNKKLINLVEKIKSINNSNLLDGIKFGHSYFCGLNKEDDSDININEKIEFITNYEIIPQLKEYLIGDDRKINKIVEFLKDDNNEVNVDKFLNRSNNEDEELEDEE